MLVVHFYPIVFHAMLHARSRLPLLVIVQHLPLEVAGQFSSEKRQHVLGGEPQRRVVHQLLVDRFQCGGRVEHDVGRVFDLIGDPVMGHLLEDVLQERIDKFGVFFQDLRPVHFRDPVGEALSTLELFRVDVVKGVVDLTVLDSMLVHFSGENVVSVDAYLYGHGKVRLDSDVNHSQFSVDKIKVEAALFSRGVDELGLAFAVSDFETSPGFHGPKDADEPFVDPVFVGDFLGEFFFALSEFDFDVGSVEFCGVVLGVLDDAFGVFVDELSEVFDEDVVSVEETDHGFGVAERQIALKNDTIETFDASLDFVLENSYKIVHGVSAFGDFLRRDNANIVSRKRNAFFILCLC